MPSEYQKVLTTQLQRLDTAFGQVITKPRVDAIKAVLEGYDSRHIIIGTTWLINNKTRLPSNFEIIEAIKAEKDKEWNAMKMKDAHQSKDFLEGRKAIGPYEQKAFRAMESARISNTITGKTHLMYELETEYPGLGWKEQADGLTRDLQVLGVPA